MLLLTPPFSLPSFSHLLPAHAIFGSISLKASSVRFKSSSVCAADEIRLKLRGSGICQRSAFLCTSACIYLCRISAHCVVFDGLSPSLKKTWNIEPTPQRKQERNVLNDFSQRRTQHFTRSLSNISSVFNPATTETGLAECSRLVNRSCGAHTKPKSLFKF